MRAVTVVEGEGRVEVAARREPTLDPGDVLVRVHGAGLNRADLLQRAGLYPAPAGSPPDVPGLEFSGVVAAVGAGVDQHVVGGRVFGVSGGGGQAELLAVPAGQCTPVPDALDLVVAGGVPEAFVTAHDALVTRARLRAGEWALVHAVGSGVGTAVLTLARVWGAHVVGTARTATKLERAQVLGLEAGIVPPTAAGGALDAAALADSVLEATGGHGADVVIDLVGGPYVEASVAAAAPLGRIVLVGALAGASARLSVLTVMQRRLELHGTVLRSRSVAEKAAAVQAFADDVVPLLAAGEVEPVVEAVVPLADAAAAYDRLASDATFGKIVLDCT